MVMPELYAAATTHVNSTASHIPPTLFDVCAERAKLMVESISNFDTTLKEETP